MDVPDKVREARGDRGEILRLRDELHRVIAGASKDERTALAAAISALDGVIHGESTSQGSEATGRSTEISRGRPVRSLVLDALDDLGWPAYTRELGVYCRARYGREIAPTRFGTLASDEIKSYERARQPRTVWLCFALTSIRAESIRRLWARSDWPLERRIAAPTSGRIQHLKLTARLCEIAMEAADTAADPEMLRIIAADHARDLPGIKFRRGEFPLGYWRDLATELLAKAEPADEEARREAAARFRKMPEQQQLFGALEIVEGLDRVRSSKERPR